MEKEHQNLRSHERWAHFRFSVIGPLLAAPPARGQLQKQLKELGGQKVAAPDFRPMGRCSAFRPSSAGITKRSAPRPVRWKCSSAKSAPTTGTHPSVGPKLIELLAEQHRQHPSWSYQLHFDNLVGAGGASNPRLGPMPSYVSLLRYMKEPWAFQASSPGSGPQSGSPSRRAAAMKPGRSAVTKANMSTRLWHLDFHHGSLRVLLDRRPMGLSDFAGHPR